MKSTSLLALALPLLQTATAKVTGFMAPSQIGAGDMVKIVITNHFNGSLIEDGATDVALTFGLADGNAGNPEGKGETLSIKFLGFDNSNINHKVNHYIQIPADWPHGMADIASVLFEIVPLDGNPNIPNGIFRNFKLPVMVGPLNSTNSKYVTSTEFTPPPLPANATM